MDITKSQLDIEIAKGEFRRIQIFIGALVIGLIIMLFNFFLVKGTTSFFNNSETKFYVIGWLILFILYETFGFFLAKILLQKKKNVPDVLKILNVVIEAASPGILIVFLCYHEESVIFIDSPLIFFYFILLTLSSLNLDIKLSLIIGIISAGGYLLATVWAINNYDPEHLILHFPPILYYARSIFMMLAALSAVFVTKEIRKRHFFSFNLKKERDEIELLFGQQVSQAIVKTLIDGNYKTKKHEVSIMFLDIRNYSVYAEKNSPETVIKFQNTFFDPVLRIIQKHEGITNQILGDGLMATFGAPSKEKDHAQRAFDAGREIMKKINELNLNGELPGINIGIGLHTGKVVMGNIGNEFRRQFSISGTSVVIAARIEQACKTLNRNFLVSKDVYNKIKFNKAKVESMGEIKMKNISKKIEVYSVES